ncbi:Myosin light chain kinase, smooth muscle [Araneus ventricosus]|uniref:Myosin light chain kinase, smooth muscle n=1 Tax=Araneus ventricosus TaxID=182803 RepID=A0A4Y2FW99_ARAVE|nr:Myosin light chain kinase, smooth muscle [Araneus ventricosus]
MWDSVQEQNDHIRITFKSPGEGRDGLVVRSRPWDRRASGLKPDSTEDPPCTHAKSYAVAKRPPAGLAWKFGKGVPVQASPSSSDRGSKLQGNEEIAIMMNSRSCPSPRRSLRACAPRFLQPLQVRNENEIRVFECHVDGYPRPDIRWERSGKPIGKSRRVHMTRSGDKCLLQIRMPQIEDMDVYSCIATNIVGTATTQFKVGSAGIQKMNGISNQRLSPSEKKPVRSRSMERSLESISDEKSHQSVSRIRSESGSRKSRQDLPKSKISNFANNIWKRNDNAAEKPHIETQKQKREILIDISKKQLSKSMDDCRKNKRSFLNRVKIPDIFSPQKAEAEPEPLKNVLNENDGENHRKNGEMTITVHNSKNSLKVVAPNNCEKMEILVSNKRRSAIDDAPIQLSTRERIAAYMKRFENPQKTDRSKESAHELEMKKVKPKETPGKGRSLKRNISNEKKLAGEEENKLSVPNESDSSFFSFNKFMRRKSYDGDRKQNESSFIEVKLVNTSLDLECKSNEEGQNNMVSCLSVDHGKEQNSQTDTSPVDIVPNISLNNETEKSRNKTNYLTVENSRDETLLGREKILAENISNESKSPKETERCADDKNFFSKFMRRKSSDSSKRNSSEDVMPDITTVNTSTKHRNSLPSCNTNVDSLTAFKNTSVENIHECKTLENKTENENVNETVKTNDNESPQGKKIPLKRNVSNEKIVDGVVECKPSERKDADSGFFSLSRFLRRKSSDNSKKHNDDENKVEDSSTDIDHESKAVEKDSVNHLVPDINRISESNSFHDSENSTSIVFLKCNVPSNKRNCDEKVEEIKNTSPSLSSCDLDLGAFQPIDTNLLDTFEDLKNIDQSLPEIHDNIESSTDHPTTVSQTSSEGDEKSKETTLPLIHIEQEDSEDDFQFEEDVAGCTISSEPLEELVCDKQVPRSLNIKKPFKGNIGYSSPLIEEECEDLPDEESQTLTLKTDLQRVSSPVESPARIIKGPQSVTVLRGESVTLAICFNGYPPPQVTWMKGGRVLSDEGGRLSILDGREMSVVTVNDVTADDSGKYVVSVENQGGGDSCFASVAVVGFPEPPGGEPTASEVTDHSLVLSWYGSMYDGGSVVTGYIVEMCTLPDKKWHKVASSVNTSCSVPGLSKGQRYIFRVRAENRYGSSHPSKESKIICLDDFLNDESSEDEEPSEELSAPITIESGNNFTERFDLKEEVGKGRFGTVYRCVERSCSRPRAAKVIRCLKVKDKEKVRQEIEIMSRLHHPKLMQVLAAFESGRNMIMVMEYISGGELFERVIADDFVLTEQDCILFMRQILDGVAYMHRNNVLHLDLKPENILCKTRTSHKIKIIDFGLARIYKQDDSLRILFGTPEFVAPEVINYEPVCPASDMWSVGVICYVLLSGLSPFMGDNDTETFANITRGEMDFDDEAFDEISDDAKDFISKLLVKSVRNRMSSEQCLKHPWLATAGLSQKRPLSTEKLKRFIIRRKWQKSGTAIRALGRMVSLSRSSLGSSCDSYSPLGSPTSSRSRSRSSIISRSETTDSAESDVFQDLSR